MKRCISCGNTYESDDWKCHGCGTGPEHRSGFLSFLMNPPQEPESYDHRYFPELFELENRHFWFQYRNGLIVWALQTYFPCIHNILEIGCGTGCVLKEIHQSFSQVKLSGSDLYSEGLQFAHTRVPQASFYQMDAYDIPFRNEFDVILALDVIEHIEDDEKALAEIYRAIRLGGGLILTVPQHGWLWSVHDEKAYHKRRYSWQMLRRKMSSCGFDMVYHTSFISLLLPVMVVSRMYTDLFMKDRGSYDPLRELKVGPFLNHIFGMICTMEGYVLMKGFRMPVGGSLLCIGVKK